MYGVCMTEQQDQLTDNDHSKQPQKYEVYSGANYAEVCDPVKNRPRTKTLFSGCQRPW